MAQLEVISSSKEFVLPQTGMFNPRKETSPSSLLCADSFLLLCVDGLNSICRDGWMEPDSVTANTSLVAT